MDRTCPTATVQSNTWSRCQQEKPQEEMQLAVERTTALCLPQQMSGASEVKELLPQRLNCAARHSPGRGTRFRPTTRLCQAFQVASRSDGTFGATKDGGGRLPT